MRAVWEWSYFVDHSTKEINNSKKRGKKRKEGNTINGGLVHFVSVWGDTCATLLGTDGGVGIGGRT
jgi:hypothetical protein